MQAVKSSSGPPRRCAPLAELELKQFRFSMLLKADVRSHITGQIRNALLTSRSTAPVASRPALAGATAK